MGDFEIDTRLHPVDGAEGRFRAELSEDWRIWGPNGGYVAAIALRAAGRVARISRPASFSGHFLGVAEFAPVDVEVSLLRGGRRAESLRVSIRQGERHVFEALVRKGGSDIHRMLEEITQALARHTSGQTPFDDITIVALRREASA